MINKIKSSALLMTILITSININAQEHSVAREWNEELLEAIRNDFARPTIHARNLFHSSMIMYDAWALFDDTSEPVFLGKNFGGFEVVYDDIIIPTNREEATNEIMSYALYRLLTHRFSQSPNAIQTLESIEEKFTSLSYDAAFTSTDYSTNSHAALGNYLGEQMIAFGLQDGANESNAYENQFYTPTNSPLVLELYEDNTNINPDRWQPLAFDVFIDQSGNTIPLGVPDFLNPEWGQVTPFALNTDSLEIFNIGGFDYYVYNDPGIPSYIQDSNENGIDDPYKWGFSLVTSWSKHLDPFDGVMIDISPSSIGNIQSYPTTFEEYKAFYNYDNGGDSSIGHTINPITGQAYEPQIVPRGDYARVLAEFWADGPDSETPPGHWFTILNYVSDHPLLEKKFGGQGETLSNLEWDVKLYFLLGSAMHDSAVNTWGLKGYYDYIRPISSLRYMAGKGQSTDASLPSYDPHGLPLVPGVIELVEEGDPLAGDMGEFVGALKVNTWKGPDYINYPELEIAGVDWIYADQWWPYQRPTFVTPPFAGYISGHSTFSSAAAEILTLATGDAFFPGGIGTFDIQKNNFLVFEQGPSESLQLQWATYKDASDQTSLSRIWGGIHPPIDDIPGRLLGTTIGEDAFNLALKYFDGSILTNTENIDFNIAAVFPNPATEVITINTIPGNYKGQIINLDGRVVQKMSISSTENIKKININNLQSGIYFLELTQVDSHLSQSIKIIKN